MSTLRVNKISNESGSGSVEFTKGATFPSSQNFTSTDLTINTAGIATITDITATQMSVVGVMTATSFVGNGFNITNPPGTAVGKVIGQHLIT